MRDGDVGGELIRGRLGVLLDTKSRSVSGEGSVCPFNTSEIARLRLVLLASSDVGLTSTFGGAC